MAFNHYAKIKRILRDYPGWMVVRIDEPTRAQSFKGEIREFGHYYRVYDSDLKPIKFCKFQQIELFAKHMGCAVEELEVVPKDVLDGAR